MIDFFDKGIMYGLGIYYTGLIVVIFGAVVIIGENNWDATTRVYWTPIIVLGVIFVLLGALLLLSVGVITILKRRDENMECIENEI